eukprot:793885-Amorphochlora_amoeboformis.AAC.1
MKPTPQTLALTLGPNPNPNPNPNLTITITLTNPNPNLTITITLTNPNPTEGGSCPSDPTPSSDERRSKRSNRLCQGYDSHSLLALQGCVFR